MAQETNDDKPSMEDLRKEVSKLDESIQKVTKLKSVIQEEQKPLYSIYKWQAPERIFQPRSKRWYLTVAIISMVIIVFSALTNNFGLIFAIVALILLTYALQTVPPREVTHELTNKGLNVFENLFLWKNIEFFWVTERDNTKMINFEAKLTKNTPSQRLILLEGSGNLKKVVNELTKHIDYLPEQEATSGITTRLTDGKYIKLSQIVPTQGEIIIETPPSPEEPEEEQL